MRIGSQRLPKNPTPMKLSTYQLKPKFQQLLKPLLVQLVQWRITPNQITLAALLLSLLYGTALLVWADHWEIWLGLPFFMLLRMALNALDGMLANFSNQKTALGTLLNEMGDQLSDAALILPFAWVAGINMPLLFSVAFLALLAEFSGVLAALVGAPRRYDGPMGKSDRAVGIGLLACMVAGNTSAAWLNGLLLVIAVLLVITGFNRLRSALRHQSAPRTP
jgi:CDP-diacylglycerol--glycerol-3-phosphate 3-phosphatidyltransferase